MGILYAMDRVGCLSWNPKNNGGKTVRLIKTCPHSRCSERFRDGTPGRAGAQGKGGARSRLWKVAEVTPTTDTEEYSFGWASANTWREKEEPSKWIFVLKS